MLQSALLLTVTGPYFDFGSHFRAALALTAEKRGVTVSEADEKAILARCESCRRIPRSVTASRGFVRPAFASRR